MTNQTAAGDPKVLDIVITPDDGVVSLLIGDYEMKADAITTLRLAAALMVGAGAALSHVAEGTEDDDEHAIFMGALAGMVEIAVAPLDRLLEHIDS